MSQQIVDDIAAWISLRCDISGDVMNVRLTPTEAVSAGAAQLLQRRVEGPGAAARARAGAFEVPPATRRAACVIA